MGRMRLQVTPSMSRVELAALERALEEAGAGLDIGPGRPVTAWARLAASEGVDSGVEACAARYARSPRSTPGATRA